MRPKKDTPFSVLLRRMRGEAGFRTAYQFYHDNGGQAVLKISYRKYLLIEQGRLHPAPERLRTIFFALRLIPRTHGANELVVAWLRTMLGEEAYSDLFEPLLCGERKAAGFSPLHKALKTVLSSRKHHVTPGQFAALLTDFPTYLCGLAMENDGGVWAPRELAAALRLPEAAAARAIKSLASVKFLKEVRKGMYRCPLAGAVVEYPQLNTVPKALRGKLREYHARLVKSGFTEWESGCTIRADAAAFRNFYPLMGLNISTAQTYSIFDKRPGSALFYVTGKVVKLRDF